MVAGETRVSRVGAWKRRGRPDLGSEINPRDLLTAGTYKPDAPSDAGVWKEDRLQQVTPSGGVMYLDTPGQVIKDMEIFGAVQPRAPGCKILNSRIRGTMTIPGGDYGLVQMTHENGYGFLMQDVEIAADLNHFRMNGIRGGRFDCERVWFHNLVDGADTWLTTVQRPVQGAETATTRNYDIDVSFTECVFEAFQHHRGDNNTTGIVHPSDFKTHNDAVQSLGGYGMEVNGCFFDMYHVDGYTWSSATTTTGPGTAAVDDDLCALMMNTSQAIGGEHFFHDSWFKGCYVQINTGGHSNYGIGDIKRNKSSNRVTKVSNSDPGWFINFSNGSTAQSQTRMGTGTNRNFNEGTSVVARNNGVEQD